MAYFPGDFIDRLLNSVPIVQVVGRHVALRKRGREYVGLCPFHTEKTPSFKVREDDHRYHCFGCGAHGDTIDFIMAKEGLSFTETIGHLASLAGIPLPTTTGTQDPRQKDTPLLRRALDLAQNYYAGMLHTPKGQQGLIYLKNRGLNDDTMQTFALGFAPAGGPQDTSFVDYMISQGMTEDTLIKTGLVHPSYPKRPYFFGRVMFPIWDKVGHMVGFGARAMGDGQPKYLNSPETPLFTKSHLVYNYHRARNAVRDGHPLIVVEGYMDVISLYAYGFQGAVAPMGTALTPHQLNHIWTIDPQPIFCFDGDQAGQKAAQKTALLMLETMKPGMGGRFISLPSGQDPDSFLRSHGSDQFKNFIDHPLSLFDIVWQSHVPHQAQTSPESIALFRQRMMDIWKTIPENVTRQLYTQTFLDRFNATFFTKKQHQSPLKNSSPSPLSAAKAGSLSHQRHRTITPSKIFLTLAINHPDVVSRHIEDFAALHIEPLWKKLHQAILDFLAHYNHDRSSAVNLRDAMVHQGHGESIEKLISPDVYVHAPHAKPTSSDDDAETTWVAYMSAYYQRLEKKEKRKKISKN